jgi:hypothetical protein
MTGPDHYRKAEELAAKAAEYLGQEDGQDSAAVWAAVDQVRTTLALAAATVATAADSTGQAADRKTKVYPVGPSPRRRNPNT